MLSTGFDIDKVIAAALPRIGWRNPTKSGYGIVDNENQTSKSGRYFNDNSFHASCTIQNLKDTQEDEAITDSNFNKLLKDLKYSVISTALNAVFSDLDYIESGLVYALPDRYTVNTVANTGKFCGFRLTVGKGPYAVQVQKAPLLFDQDADFKLYLFRDFKKAAIKDIDVSVTAGEIAEVDVSEVFNYLSSSNKGGSYYLGYFQDDLGGAKAMDFAPCKNCYKVFSAESIIADPVLLDAQGNRSIDMVNYQVSTQMRGMNLELASYKDHTDDIIKGLHQFDQLIGLYMAAKVIEVILNSTRSNKTERINKENLAVLYAELNNAGATEDQNFVPGLKFTIAREVKRLQKVFHQKSHNQIAEL